MVLKNNLKRSELMTCLVIHGEESLCTGSYGELNKTLLLLEETILFQ